MCGTEGFSKSDILYLISLSHLYPIWDTELAEIGYNIYNVAQDFLSEHSNLVQFSYECELAVESLVGLNKSLENEFFNFLNFNKA